MHGSNWFIYQCQSILNIHKYFLNRKNYSVHFLLRRNTGSRTWDTRLRSWTKMLRKMHVVCLILEYFPLEPGSLKILPPLPQKTKLKCGRNIFAPAQTTLTWAGWGEGSPWCQIRGVSFLWVRKCKMLNPYKSHYNCWWVILDTLTKNWVGSAERLDIWRQVVLLNYSSRIERQSVRGCRGGNHDGGVNWTCLLLPVGERKL